MEREVTSVTWIVVECEVTKVHLTAARASLDLAYFSPEAHLMFVFSLCHLILWLRQASDSDKN